MVTPLELAPLLAAQELLELVPPLAARDALEVSSHVQHVSLRDLGESQI